MRRRATVWILTLLALAMVAGPAAASRNVLLMIADDLGMNDLGCYGNPDVKTPQIDRFAKEATRFSHAFATTASCSPSRSVLYTGLHNHFNGQYGLAHSEHHFVQRPQVQTLFMLLKNAGYKTAIVGKKHVLPEEKYPLDFEPRVNPRDVQAMARLAAEFMQSAGEQPFFLVVGFTDPHRDFGNNRTYQGVDQVRYDPARLKVHPWLPDQPEVREELAEYYQSISRMDVGVGAILEGLAKSGKQDDTLVMFTSDNGMPFPGAKTNLYEPSVRLPFLVRRPGQVKRGNENSAMISFTDVTPTILDWANVQGPKAYALHGQSFLKLVDDPSPAGWDEVYCSHTFHEVTMYYPMRVVRGRRYKLILNIASPLSFPHASDLFGSRTWQGVLARKDAMLGSRPVEKYLHRDPVELYDLDADPNELKNLASDPDFAAVRGELAGKLRRFQERTGDPWVVRYKY